MQVCSVMGTVTIICTGLFSLPGRGNGRCRTAKNPQGQMVLLRANASRGGLGKRWRSHLALYSKEAFCAVLQLAHQSSNPSLPSIRRHLQFVQLSSVVSGGVDMTNTTAAISAGCGSTGSVISRFSSASQMSQNVSAITLPVASRNYTCHYCC